MAHERFLQRTGSHEAPGAPNESREFIVSDGRQQDANPAANPDIWGPEKDLRSVTDHHRLESGAGGQPDGDPAVVVVVVGKHREYFTSNEESGFAVGKLFLAFGHSEANAADPLDRLRPLPHTPGGFVSKTMRISLTEWVRRRK